MNSDHRVPLFINRFSLSSRTSVGVQTGLLLAPHSDWLHFHWWSSSFKRLDPRSILLENRFLSRYSFLHNVRFMRFCERLGMSAWVGDGLRPEWAARVENFRGRVSCIYLAPLDEADALRCLYLANLIGAPFVLHLWDVLEGDVRYGALGELVRRAQDVFCISQPLLNVVRSVRNGGELLSFTRERSLYHVEPPVGSLLRVVMHGNIESYVEGLADVDVAIDLLKRRGITIEVSFVGSPQILRRCRTSLKKRVKVCGFQKTMHALDWELSNSHVAFLPGPKLDPKQDQRSRYSIPSRIIDYMALNLPIVGTVHPDSATGELIRTLGLGATGLCSGPEQIADCFLRLTEPGFWMEQSNRSREAFDHWQAKESPAQLLKRKINHVAFTHASRLGDEEYRERTANGAA
jgi:hypothetical protein